MKFASLVTNWKIWSIPIGLGIVSIVIDTFFLQWRLHDDFACWVVTILGIFIAVAILKGFLGNVNPIVGAWGCFFIITGIWLLHLFSITPSHLLHDGGGEKMGERMITEIIALAVLLLLGVILYSGKGLIFIAGYHKYYNMPQIEKNKYDYETLVKSKFMGKIFFAVSFGMVFLIISDIFGVNWLSIVGWVLTICMIAFVVIYKFKK